MPVALLLPDPRPARPDGTDLVEASQEFDPTTNEPIVVLSLTDSGVEGFQELTRTVARRGAKQSAGAASEKPQHVALIVDDQVLSLPVIDFKENPSGVDASSGVQISGGLSVGEAQALARALNPG